MGIPSSVNPLFLGAAGAGVEDGYLIERSLRFNSADSAYLSRTPASAGNRKTWTWAGWVKRSGLGTDQALLDCRPVASDSQFTVFYLKASNTLELSGPVTTWRTTTQLFRDASAWYHIVLALDTTQSTASSRVKIYVNGVQVTAFATSADPSQNADLGINQSSLHGIGASSGGSPAAFLNGYLADIHFIDGQALDPTSFGEFDATTGVWVPKAYTGTYGTNGFQLKFEDNSSNTATTLGKDTSGNGNNWTPNNLSVTAGAGNDSLVDVPTNGAETDTGAGGEVRGNYCTFNPLAIGSGVTLSNGNLDFASSTANSTARSTFAVSSGKWYWEITATTSTPELNIGITDASTYDNSVYPGATASSYGYYTGTGQKLNNGTLFSYGASIAVGDVVGIALDMDAGTITFYKNGSSQGTAFTGLTGAKQPAVSSATGGTKTATANFGQRPFAYTAPSGFKALNTANLPAPLVTKPSDLFDVKLYTGNGSTQTISGLGFSPDMVWIKGRSVGAGHLLSDTVRGIDKGLYANSTDVEDAFKVNGYVSAATTASFTVTAGTTDAIVVNNLSQTYVAWTWDAGTTTTTNTVGSISSQVRANASAGFSVVTYTGTGTTATVGHGLGVAPELIICKRRNSVVEWVVYHKSTGRNGYLVLNSTAAFASLAGYWGASDPSSTVISYDAGGYGGNNASGGTYVAYCFAPVAGLSAYGSYTGNGSADGSFVYTSHLPKLILIKRTDTTSNWTMLDTSRLGYNVDNNPLYPNLADAEATTDLLDITSNGFKLRSTDASVNASGGTYIYASWASSPFNYSRAR